MYVGGSGRGRNPAGCAVSAIFPLVLAADEYLTDGEIASNTWVTTILTLSATWLIVLSTGFACALTAPPTREVARQI